MVGFHWKEVFTSDKRFGKGMKFISLDEVVVIHDQMIMIGGGSGGVKDFSLLHSAVERPRAQFGGKYLYESVWEMAGALLQSLVKNHPFADGNKRTAYFSCLRFLNKNRIDLFVKRKDILEFMVSVDVEDLEVKEIAEWLKKHAIKVS